MIDWKSKLSSRKFWAGVVGFVTAVAFAFGVSEPAVEQIVALVSALAVLVAYIFGEGMVDKARKTEKE